MGVYRFQRRHRLLVKNNLYSTNITTFLLAFELSFILSLISWSVVPFAEGIVVCDLNLGILYLFAVLEWYLYLHLKIVLEINKNGKLFIY